MSKRRYADVVVEMPPPMDVSGLLTKLIESGAVDGEDPRAVFEARHKLLVYDSLEGIRRALHSVTALLAARPR